MKQVSRRGWSSLFRLHSANEQNPSNITRGYRGGRRWGRFRDRRPTTWLTLGQPVTRLVLRGRRLGVGGAPPPVQAAVDSVQQRFALTEARVVPRAVRDVAGKRLDVRPNGRRLHVGTCGRESTNDLSGGEWLCKPGQAVFQGLRDSRPPRRHRRARLRRPRPRAVAQFARKLLNFFLAEDPPVKTTVPSEEGMSCCGPLPQRPAQRLRVALQPTRQLDSSDTHETAPPAEGSADNATASSTKRHSALTSRRFSGFLTTGVSSAGLHTTAITPRAREIATLNRFRL